MIFEASSSCKLEILPTWGAMEGAVFRMACLIPALISSEVVSGGGVMAEGAIRAR